jgi:acetoacetate decarboxylase
MEPDEIDTLSETPGDSPLYPHFPMEMRDVEILTVFYRTDPAAARRLVPRPLEPAGDVVIVHIYHMHDADMFGDYYESAVQLPVTLPGRDVSGAYSPYLYLGSMGAVAVGREIYGQPKKDGEPRLEARGDLWVGTVTRNGIDVITASLPYKTRRADPAGLLQHGDFRTNINLKVINGIDGQPAIRQLTARRFENVRIHECWAGPATIELRPNAQAPVYRLPVREMLDGLYWRTDFVLPYGQVVHDYLTAKGTP